jgi:hypothetical protein
MDFGATRVYCDDKNWKARFVALSESAICILTTIDLVSHNLGWELNNLRERGIAHKLFFITKPHMDDRIEASYLKFWAFILGNGHFALGSRSAAMGRDCRVFAGIQI